MEVQLANARAKVTEFEKRVTELEAALIEEKGVKSHQVEEAATSTVEVALLEGRAQTL